MNKATAPVPRPERRLEIGVYTPSPQFLEYRELIAVFDANNPGQGPDGGLVLLLGPTLAAGRPFGIGRRSVRQSERDAGLFIAAGEMMAALEAAETLDQLEYLRDHWAERATILPRFGDLAALYPFVFSSGDTLEAAIPKMADHAKALRVTALVKARTVKTVVKTAKMEEQT